MSTQTETLKQAGKPISSFVQLVCGNQSVATLNPITEVTIVCGGVAEKVYRLGKVLHWTDVEMAGVLGTSPKAV